MRTKAHRYSAYVVATFTSGSDVIGVTGDFDGGFVQVNAFLQANLGTAGQWMNAQFKVDGTAQGAIPSAYQQAAGPTDLWLVTTLRVPQGRHRISVVWGSSTAPIAGSTADLSVAELTA